MLYNVIAPHAEDDGSAWDYEQRGGRFFPRQARPLSIALLADEVRAVAVGVCLVVDEHLAAAVRAAVPGAQQVRTIVRGPQPEMLARPDMVQICPVETVHLAEESIRRSESGEMIGASLPLVLQAECRRSAARICRIEENGMTVFSREIRALLESAEPRLSFGEIRYTDEDCD
jgi:hypothetical protein